MKKSIGIISDTHIYEQKTQIPRKIREAFWDVEYIVHSGDISTPCVLEELQKIAPVKAVIGNKFDDNVNFVGILPEILEFNVNGVRILVVHGSSKIESNIDNFIGKDKNILNLASNLIYLLKHLVKFVGFKRVSNYMLMRRLASKYTGKVDCIIFGHTHVTYMGYYRNILFLNPGDAQYSHKNKASLIKLTIDTEGKMDPRLIDLHF